VNIRKVALIGTILSSATLLSLSVPIQAREVSRDTGQVLTPPPPGLLVHRMPPSDDRPTAAYQWLQFLLEASGREVALNKPRPTILSRTMAVCLTSMYDAWAAYDAKAVGTRLHGKLRRPVRERTKENKEKAIAYAAYRSLLFVYAEDAAWIRERFREKGYDPDNDSTDLRTPEGIGNAAAKAVIDYRRRDGANQLGDEPGGNGKPYADYTGYAPKNAPDNIVDPDRWFPIPFSDGKGGTVSPGFLTPHWYKVKPFALERSEQFRPPPPPKYGSERLKKEVEEVIRLNAGLSLEQKTVVELMREGPRSTGQSGHWLQFAMDVPRRGYSDAGLDMMGLTMSLSMDISRRDHHDLDQDIKLFFSVGNVVMDAFIACWEAKRHYDASRPYWWVRLYHKGETLDGWLGPGKGSGKLKAEEWKPYSPDTFITPPFPGYVSGHATASGAASRMLELFTGSDRYGAAAFQQAGELTEPGFSAALMQAQDGKPALDVPESKEIRLFLPTFTATAEMAALSRLWGGYHIRVDNDEGLILGRKIAMYSWPKYRAYFEGTAPAPRETP
jgi:hypothetical protein